MERACRILLRHTTCDKAASAAAPTGRCSNRVRGSFIVTLSHIGAAPATCTVLRLRAVAPLPLKFAKPSALRAGSSGMKLHQFHEPVPAAQSSPAHQPGQSSSSRACGIAHCGLVLRPWFKPLSNSERRWYISVLLTWAVLGGYRERLAGRHIDCVGGMAPC
jgi:hypothetical protein